MKKLIAALLFAVVTLTWAADSIARFPRGAPVTQSSNLRQENFFGLTGSAWQNFQGNYTPGLGNPAVSTADYYGQSGVSWMRPYDLLDPACGATGASIAASRGRYVWPSSADHQGGTFTFMGTAGFRLGFSNDPGVPPKTIDLFQPSWYRATAPQTATITASISNGSGGAGNILNVTAVSSGLVTNDAHANVSGAGVTTAVINSQSSGTAGQTGNYVISGAAQLVASQAMVVTQTNYNIYQNPYFVCNPDDATYPFYIYAEGAGSGIQHEQGLTKSADLITWTVAVPSHVTLGFPQWSSFQRPVRDGVNSWHSTGFQFLYPQSGNTYSKSVWTSTNGRDWVPGTSSTNSCIPANSPGHSTDCKPNVGTSIGMNLEAAPDRVTIGAQDWALGRVDQWNDGDRVNPQWLGRAPIDSNFNVLSSPTVVKIAEYAGAYPGPTFLQNTGAYIEDGIVHYYVSTGFPTSDSLYGLVPAAPYANGGACFAVPGGSFRVMGSITGGVMTVTSLVTNNVVINAGLTPDTPNGIPTGVSVTGQLTGPAGGVGTYSVSNVGFTSGSNIAIVGLTCGGLWQQGLDYYTEIIDPVAAAGAAPAGARASCAASTATINWYGGVLPTDTMRLYYGPTAGSQTTLVGDFTGTTATYTGMTLNAVGYYKLVYLNGGVEKKNRVVSTYCSTSSAFVNEHLTRALAAGADPATCNRTFMDAFDGWLVANGKSSNLLLATSADFCVAQSGNITKIFDMGTTRLPKGGDYTPMTSNTTYNATGINGKPAWVNSTNTAYGYYGGGPSRINTIQRKTQITLFAAYQKSHTNAITPFIMAQFTNRLMLQHGSGSPGSISCLISDATQQKNATVAVAGLATDVHSAACTFDGTDWKAWSDAVAGSAQTGLVIPSPNLNPPDMLTGQIGQSGDVQTGLIRVLASGGDGAMFNIATEAYVISSNQAQYSARIQAVFDIALTGAEQTSLDALVR